MLPTNPELLEAAADVLAEDSVHPRFHHVLHATKGQKHELDGKPIKLHKFFAANSDPLDTEWNIGDDDLDHIKKLKAGETHNLGGGAAATFKLKRTK